MTKRTGSIVALLIAGLPPAAAAQSTRAAIDIASLADPLHPLSSVEWRDFVFGETRRYTGYWLSDVISRIPGYQALNSRESLVVFATTDGYNPLLAMEKISARKGFLALSNTPSGRGWVNAGSHKTFPGPAYLIWEAAGEDEEHSGYPWPYQIVKIQLVSKAAALKVLRPKGLAGLDEGATLFQEHCLKCHGVDGIGGTKGPSTEILLDVAEHWAPDTLASFILHPRSVIAASKMPDSKGLSTASAPSIVDYLKAMSKVAPRRSAVP